MLVLPIPSKDVHVTGRGPPVGHTPGAKAPQVDGTPFNGEDIGLIAVKVNSVGCAVQMQTLKRGVGYVASPPSWYPVSTRTQRKMGLGSDKEGGG